jgi:hypothetical protein
MIHFVVDDSLPFAISRETISKEAFMTCSPITSSKKFGARAPSIFPPVTYYEKIRQEIPAPIPMYLEPAPHQPDNDWGMRFKTFRDRLETREMKARFWVEPSLYAFFDHAWGDKEFEPTHADFIRQDWGLIGAEKILNRTVQGRGTKRARKRRDNMDLPDFSKRIREFVLKKRDEGKTVIGFKRAEQALTQWHDNKAKDFAFNWKLIKSTLDLEERRIYLGHVMPLYKAQVIARLEGINTDKFIEDTVIHHIRKIYNLNHLGAPDGAANEWPVVLTMDNWLTPLQNRDEIADIHGNIVYQHGYSEAHISPSGRYGGSLNGVTSNYTLFDTTRKREILDPKRKEIAERNGWPNSPLSPILAVINKEEPFKVQLEKAQRAYQKHGMPLAQPLYR